MKSVRPVIRSVAFILIDRDRMLVERRSPTKRTDPGKICIPSGGIEERESAQDALKREMREELDLVPDAYTYIDTIRYDTDEVSFDIAYFTVERWHGAIKTLEADELLWLPVHEDSVDTPPDKDAIRRLREELLQ